MENLAENRRADGESRSKIDFSGITDRMGAMKLNTKWGKFVGGVAVLGALGAVLFKRGRKKSTLSSIKAKTPKKSSKKSESRASH